MGFAGMSTTAVAVVNYNTRDLLRQCLDTVLIEIPDEIVVVDNASSDGSAEMVKADFPGITLLENKKNLGYSVAVNQAVRHCSSEFILLLNSDTLVKPGTLHTLADYMHLNLQVAVVGPRLVNPDGSLQASCYSFPTPLDIFLDVTHLSRLIGYVPYLKERHLRSWSHNRTRHVPWVLGAATLLRRKSLEEVGGFEESFFMYYEEVDLCYRLTKRGWQIHYNPAVVVTHIGGASTQQARAEMAVQFYSSLAHFYSLHYSHIRMAELVIIITCVALGRLVRDTLLFSITKQADKRTQLQANLEAWQRLLRGDWRWQQSRRGSNSG